MPQGSRVERVLNLIAVLSETGRALSASEIRQRVPGYSDDDVSFRRAFERDKAILRELGVEIDVEPVPAAPEGVGYKVRRSKAHMPELGLDDNEVAAVSVALAAAQLLDEENGGIHEDLAYGALKVGAEDASAVSPTAFAYAPVATSLLAKVVEAMTTATRVSFEYAKPDGSSSRRMVEPHGLRFIRGHWYLIGSDAGLDTLKAFRLDRIVGDIHLEGTPGAFEKKPVDEVVSVLSRPPWQIGEGPEARIVVEVDSAVARIAERLLMSEPVAQNDETSRFELATTNPDAAIDAVLRFRDLAVVVEPIELREAVEGRIRAILDWLSDGPTGEAATAVREAQSAVSGGDGAEISPPQRRQVAAGGSQRGRAAREDAAARIKRLLTLVPWVIRHPGVELAEVCDRFRVSREQLVRDLQLLTLTGSYPYSPTDLVDVCWSGGRLVVRHAPHLERFFKPGRREAVALLMALKLAVRMPGIEGNSSLESAMQKIERAVGAIDADVEVEPERAGRSVLELVEKVLNAGESLKIKYVSISSERESERIVDPVRLFMYDGRWYMEAYCHSSRETRIFRISRILEAEPVPNGEPASSGDESGHERGPAGSVGERATGGRPTDDPFANIAGEPVVVVAPPDVAAWLFSSVRARRVELPCGWEAGLFKASTETWAARVLFPVSDRVWIVEPDSLREALAKTAKRALARYAASSR